MYPQFFLGNITLDHWGCKHLIAWNISSTTGQRKPDKSRAFAFRSVCMILVPLYQDLPESVTPRQPNCRIWWSFGRTRRWHSLMDTPGTYGHVWICRFLSSIHWPPFDWRRQSQLIPWVLISACCKDVAHKSISIFLPTVVLAVVYESSPSVLPIVCKFGQRLPKTHSPRWPSKLLGSHLLPGEEERAWNGYPQYNHIVDDFSLDISCEDWMKVHILHISSCITLDS